MALVIQERLKDLRVEHGLTLEQLAEQTQLTKSALGSPLKAFLQAADEATNEDSDPEKASLAFICKLLRLNFGKLTEEQKSLKKIAEKSDLLKN